MEIDSNGWRVVDKPPVRFRRAAGMQALPTPLPGGSIETLRRFLNVQGDNDFILVVAWVLAVLRNRGPYPVIVLSGEQGSAKSTFPAVLRALLDPNTAPLRALPREDRDLFIAANNGHVLAFDNASGLPAWISDTLCRLATGGGFAVRQLYTDQDEVLFDTARPVILNGIENIVTRPDLADRAIFLTLEAIPEERRRPEKELWAEFDTARPKLLGTLLDAVSHGLNRLPDTRLDSLPRIADFALWATACETALWTSGTFGAAYAGNRDEAVDIALEADPVGSAIRSLIGTRTEWKGTASDLLGTLDEVRKSKAWPSSARALSGRVRRAATFLRKVSIDITSECEGRARTCTIRITRKPESAPARPSTPSVPLPNRTGNNGFDTGDPRTVNRSADANTVRIVTRAHGKRKRPNKRAETKSMVAKRKPTKERDSNQLTVVGKPDEDPAIITARAVLNPTIQAAVTLKAYGKSYGDLDMGSLTDSLSEQTRASRTGDRQRAEVMLTAQAHTLDAIFNHLAQRAVNAEHMNHLEDYLKLALRAQSQCRSTWETLATIKNPPVMGYVRQANIAHGPQQVNNASAVPNSAPRTGENSPRQNKLLEEKDGERLDPGTACTPGRADPAMATVGEVGRTYRPSPVRRQCHRTPIRAAFGGCCASCRVPFGSRTGGWSNERFGNDFACRSALVAVHLYYRLNGWQLHGANQERSPHHPYHRRGQGTAETGRRARAPLRRIDGRGAGAGLREGPRSRRARIRTRAQGRRQVVPADRTITENNE